MDSPLPDKDYGPQAARENPGHASCDSGSCGGDGPLAVAENCNLRPGIEIHCGIIDNSQDLIGALDPEFRYIVVNRRYADEFQRIFGVPLHLGDSLVELLAGQHVPPLEHRILHKDGSTRWLRDTIVPHYDAVVEFSTQHVIADDLTAVIVKVLEP
jgi:PAS domain-containing protein